MIKIDSSKKLLVILFSSIYLLIFICKTMSAEDEPFVSFAGTSEVKKRLVIEKTPFQESLNLEAFFEASGRILKLQNVNIKKLPLGNIKMPPCSVIITENVTVGETKLPDGVYKSVKVLNNAIEEIKEESTPVKADVVPGSEEILVEAWLERERERSPKSDRDRLFTRMKLLKELKRYIKTEPSEEGDEDVSVTENYLNAVRNGKESNFDVVRKLLNEKINNEKWRVSPFLNVETTEGQGGAAPAWVLYFLPSDRVRDTFKEFVDFINDIITKLKNRETAGEKFDREVSRKRNAFCLKKTIQKWNLPERSGILMPELLRDRFEKKELWKDSPFGVMGSRSNLSMVNAVFFEYISTRFGYGLFYNGLDPNIPGFKALEPIDGRDVFGENLNELKGASLTSLVTQVVKNEKTLSKNFIPFYHGTTLKYYIMMLIAKELYSWLNIFGDIGFIPRLVASKGEGTEFSDEHKSIYDFYNENMINESFETELMLCNLKNVDKTSPFKRDLSVIGCNNLMSFNLSLFGGMHYLKADECTYADYLIRGDAKTSVYYILNSIFDLLIKIGAGKVPEDAREGLSNNEFYISESIPIPVQDITNLPSDLQKRVLRTPVSWDGLSDDMKYKSWLFEETIKVLNKYSDDLSKKVLLQFMINKEKVNELVAITLVYGLPAHKNGALPWWIDRRTERKTAFEKKKPWDIEGLNLVKGGRSVELENWYEEYGFQAVYQKVKPSIETLFNNEYESGGPWSLAADLDNYFRPRSGRFSQQVSTIDKDSWLDSREFLKQYSENPVNVDFNSIFNYYKPWYEHYAFTVMSIFDYQDLEKRNRLFDLVQARILTKPSVFLNDQYTKSFWYLMDKFGGVDSSSGDVFEKVEADIKKFIFGLVMEPWINDMLEKDPNKVKLYSVSKLERFIDDAKEKIKSEDVTAYNKIIENELLQLTKEMDRFDEESDIKKIYHKYLLKILFHKFFSVSDYKVEAAAAAKRAIEQFEKDEVRCGWGDRGDECRKDLLLNQLGIKKKEVVFYIEREIVDFFENYKLRRGIITLRRRIISDIEYDAISKLVWLLLHKLVFMNGDPETNVFLKKEKDSVVFNIDLKDKFEDLFFRLSVKEDSLLVFKSLCGWDNNLILETDNFKGLDSLLILDDFLNLFIKHDINYKERVDSMMKAEKLRLAREIILKFNELSPEVQGELGAKVKESVEKAKKYVLKKKALKN